MKLLVLKPSSLGDIIHGLQVVTALKEAKPEAQVTWVARDYFVPFVQACEAVDAVIPFERHGNLLKQVALLCRLRSQYYDCVWDLQGLFRTGLWTFLCRAPRKVGRSDAREGARLAYDTCVPFPKDPSAHALEVLLSFLQTEGIQPKLKGSLHFRPHALNPEIKPFLEPEKKGPVFLIFPNSRRKEKEWPYFKELAMRILQRVPQAEIFWLGQDRAALPKNGFEDRWHNLAGKTSVLDLVDLVCYADKVIANDSGPMHLAAALAKPTIALFGPTNPRQFGPYPLHKHTVLVAPNGDLQRLSVEDAMKHIR